MSSNGFSDKINFFFLVLFLLLSWQVFSWDGESFDSSRVWSLCSNPYRPATVLPSETNPLGILEGRMISVLEESLNLSFVRYYGVDKEELSRRLSSGSCAIAPVYGRPDELEEVAYFTIPYGRSEFVYVTLSGDEREISLESLTGKKIALAENSPAETLLRQDFSHRIEVLRYDSIERGLRAVAYGQVDVFLGNRPQIETFMKSGGLSSFKLHDSALEPLEHRLAVSRRFPELFLRVQEILDLNGPLRYDSGKREKAEVSPAEAGDISHNAEAFPDRPLLFRGDRDYPPYEYLDEEGLPAGFNVDVVKAMAKALGLEVRIELGEWDTVRQELEEGRIDGLMGMFQTAEREKNADFAVPHFIASYAVFVRKGSGISELEDLYGKTVLVQNGDMGHDFLMENMIAEQVFIRSSPEDVLKSLSDGVGDAALMSRLQGGLIIEDQRLRNLEVVGPPILQRNYCIAVPEGRSRLLAQINEGLNMIKTDGTFQAIHNKWFGFYDMSLAKNRRVYRILTLVFLVIIVVMFAFILWNRLLKREVENTTRELRESGELLRVTLASIGDAVITSDTENRITSMNHTAVELTGWMQEEVLGRSLNSVFRILDKNTRKPLQCRPEGSMNRDGKVKEPVVLVHRKGEELLVEESMTYILAENDKVLGTILVFRNKTEDVLIQERLQQAQKMQAVGELAGGVAHDFNNMLAGIMGGAELLGLCIDKESREAQFLNMIQSASHRAADLVKKLLTFARPVPTDRKLLDIYNPLGDALLLLERTADPRIRRRKEYEEGPLWVNGDHSLLQNAFLNLMINSCHAMPDGGDLFLSVRSVTLQSRIMGAMGLNLDPGNYVELQITDNGTGIPEAIQSRIFEPFFTTRGPGEGTGLGLASVFAAVKQHGGSISVNSTPGRGTSFTVLLPLADEEALHHEETMDGYRTEDGNRVLVVDDEPAVRMAATGMLKTMNFSILEAENGLQALDVFRGKKRDIALVLLDMTMPEMNGLDCFRELKAMEPGLKIILSSGYAMDDDVALMRKEGLAGFLKKPYSYTELSAEVAAVMNG